jgi:hypothetical protein
LAASITVIELNGSGTGTPTTASNIRFKTADDATQDTNNPMVKPSSGTNYSYKKTVYLNAVDSPSSVINNIKLYCDGSLAWTGVTVTVNASTTYAQATGTAGTTGAQLSGTPLFANYTAGGMLSLTGSISNPSTGKISQIVELQAVVSTSAVAGALPTETITFQYDEV